jgi:hypothetical protein
MGMVEGMGARPVFEWYGTEVTADRAYEVIQFLVVEKGVVPAVMLDDEDPHEEEGVDHSQ